MLLPNKLSKILSYLAVLTGALWTGVYLLRLLLIYQIFEGKELLLRNYIREDNLSGIYNVLNPAIASTFFLYIAFIFFFVLFLLISKINLKKNGWLFITTVIIIITFPFEAYLMTLDYRMLINLNYENLDTNFITGLMRQRITILGSFPLVQMFCYFSFFYLLLFRPLTYHEN